MKFVTINNCEGCAKAPCHKAWPEESVEEVRAIIRSSFICLNEDMDFSNALEVATLARTLKLPFVFEIKQSSQDQTAVFDMWIPNSHLNTEAHKLCNILMISQAMTTGIANARRRRSI